MKSGDSIEIIDSAAQRFSARLTLANHRVSATLEACPDAPAQTGRWLISVAQGLPKGQKMDFVVEKLTELGVAHIYPLYTERTIVEDVGRAKVDRWRRLAKSAAEQCGRATIPAVGDPQSLAGFLRAFADHDCVLFAWELAGGGPLRETLPAILQGARTVLIVVGPEGGFSNAEAQEAGEAGAHLVSLGPRILRTETAALVLSGILNYLA